MTHTYNNPKAYSENNTLQYNFAMTLINSLKIDASARVLDIGCGDGLITSELAAQASKGYVVGTDISNDMIEFASEKYADINNIKFTQMDAAENVFRGEFDLITSFNALHWVKDQPAALKGIAKAAAPSAEIALLLSHKKSLYHHTLDAVCSNQKWEDYFSNYINPRSFFEKEAYEALVKNTGLNVISITEEEMVYHFESREALIGFFRASMANIKQIPENRKEAFLEDFASAYIAALASANHYTIPVGFWCLTVRAKKTEKAPLGA